MLLRKIKTRGFLGHLGTVGTNGKLDFVQLDFTGSDLSLVHGANGAGKSTIWDALLFAFFKEHRGGGEKSGVARLIHDRADKAEISVEFELDNQIWEIYCEISKTKSGAASVLRRVCLVGDGNKLTKCEKDEAVKDWVALNIGMTAKTFVSAVLLRQGKADAFLKAEAPERKKILLELLQLDFYRKLGDQAAKRKNEQKKISDKFEAELAGLAIDAPSDDAIANQHQHIEDINQAIKNLREQQERKKNEMVDARRAANLAASIAEIETKRKQDAQFFERASEIRQKYNRLCELEKTLLRLEKLWEAKDELDKENYNLRGNQAQIAELENKLELLEAELTEAEENEESAQAALDAAQEMLQTATATRTNILKSLEQIEAIEKLETAIAAEENKLVAYKDLLSRRAQIVQNSQRFDFLRQGIERLRSLLSAEADLRKAENEFGSLNSQAAEKEHSSRDAERKIAELKTRLEVKENDKSNFQQSLSECQSDSKVLRATLDKRNLLSGKIECPTCGTTLDDSQAERIAGELEQIKNRVNALGAQECKLKTAIEEIKEQLTETAKSLLAAESQARAIESDLIRINTNREHAARAVRQCRQNLAQIKESAGEIANEDLSDFEIEFARLESAPREREQLANALQIEQNVVAVIEVRRAELESHPTTAATERTQIRRAAANSEENLRIGEAQRSVAEKDLRDKKALVEHLKNQATIGETTVKSKKEFFSDLQARCEAAGQKVEKARRAIDFSSAEINAACDDKLCFEQLQREKGDLMPFENESRDLRDAEQRKDKLDGELSGYQKELLKIPNEHRGEVELIETEYQQLVDNLKSQDENLTIARNDLCELENRKAAHLLKQSDFEQASKVYQRWNKLADALGKKGLEARIVQTAQETVKQNANKILGELSNHLFQIELEENASSDELQILVRDLKTQNATDKPRSFEFFSGGESLLIAVSLAIAIGQAAMGRTAANTLIIDEGFGALDNNRRELLVEELRRLSREVLHNGRVIVVSHQDDVKEKFSNRYFISKNDQDGLTGVEMFGGI